MLYSDDRASYLVACQDATAKKEYEIKRPAGAPRDVMSRSAFQKQWEEVKLEDRNKDSAVLRDLLASICNGAIVLEFEPTPGLSKALRVAHRDVKKAREEGTALYSTRRMERARDEARQSRKMAWHGDKWTTGGLGVRDEARVMKEAARKRRPLFREHYAPPHLRCAFRRAAAGIGRVVPAGATPTIPTNEGAAPQASSLVPPTSAVPQLFRHSQCPADGSV